MKQTLSLKLGQSLTMTPQLQQAIRLLQLSSLDLQAEIQENLDVNPMLELEEDDDAGDEDRQTEKDEAVGLKLYLFQLWTRSRRWASRSTARTRSWSMVSRSRTVTVPSARVSPSMVKHHGVPTSSWRR